MALVRYEPWSVVNRLHQSLDSFINEAFNSPEASSSPSVSWVPRVDIHEEKERFVVLADVPGVEPKDIDITAENGVLTVRGERRAEKRETENGYERVERVSAVSCAASSYPRAPTPSRSLPSRPTVCWK